MTDLRKFGDEELTDQFINDESLYMAMECAYRFETVKQLADLYFIYTGDQLDELENYWNQ